jgi:hypothetical protein
VVLDYPPGVSRRTKRLGLERCAQQTRYLLDEVRPKVAGRDAYVRSLTEQLEGSDTTTLVAYCASAPIARELGCLLRARAICLINPEFPEIRMAEDVLSSLLPGVTMAPLSDDRLCQLEKRLMEANLRSMTLETTMPNAAEAAAGFASLQIEWVAHLVAASECSAAMTGEFHVNSMDHPCAEPCPARHIVVDSDSDHMFRAPDLGDQILSELVAGG